MSDDLVERVARRLCNTAGSNWNAENFNQTDDGSDPEDQREYYRMLAHAAIAVVLEEAAKVCDAIESETWRLWKTHYDMLDQGRSDGAGDCAAAIRALVKQSTTEEERA